MLFWLIQVTLCSNSQLVQSNILFGAQLVKVLTLQGVTKLLNTGTPLQHFNNESHNPVCLYTATKQAFENIVKFYMEASDLKVITFSYSIPMGLMIPDQSSSLY